MIFNDVYQYTKDLIVLYVEDEADVRASTCSLLENYFARVDTANNGMEGLELYNRMLAEYRYDLVISDINMPHMTGLEMLREIRNNYPEQHTILMTAHTEKDYFLDAIKLGLNHYLIKPIELNEISQVLFQSAKNIVNQKKIVLQEVKEKQRIERNEAYQKALLKWSNVDFENTDNAIKELTELSAATLNIERVSFWLFNKKHTSIICNDLFILEENAHYQGMTSDRAEYPVYFKNLDKRRVLMVDDARQDERIGEFKENYLEPLDIYSVLEIPVMQNQEYLGFIRYESTGVIHHWNFEEQEFAMTLANNIALSLEVKKRYEVQEELQIQKDRLSHQAHHDQLTGLPNRTLFLDRLEQSIKQNQRNRKKMALLFIDLDRFKEINDSLGHDAGDMVLKILSQRLAEQIRDCDTLTRLGGDEFTIILDSISDTDIIVNIIQKLVSCTNNAIVINGQTLYVTLSIGISLFPNDGLSVETLLKNADAAMYKAKDNGRNTYEFYTEEMTKKAVDRVLMESNLRQAIDKKEFYINYQPQYDAGNDKMIGMEALIRWQSKELGLISPDKFIPFAEEAGLIVEIDRWVMDTAMKQFSQWYQEGFNPGMLSLNLAIRHLQDIKFIKFLKSLLNKYHFCENWLELEITEGRIMNDPESAIKTLRQVRELGISLAIDDFGTGYSSLSYLKRLPIDTLKIDRAFIMGLPDDEEDTAISKAIIALGKSLNLNIIAEGVETLEQKNFLIDNGCQWIQGYYYGRPLANNDMHKLLQNQLVSNS